MSAQPKTSSTSSANSPPPDPNPLKSYLPPSQAPPGIMAESAPVSAMYNFREWVSQAVVASFVAGGVAGAVSRTVVSPLERLKILLQVQSGSRTEYKMSTGKALAKIWREEGFKGMMAGNGTNCVRIVPYSAVQFGSYNFYKRVSPARIDVPGRVRGRRCDD